MSIKANPNILACNGIKIEDMRKLTVSQGCYCFPDKECNKILGIVNSRKTVISGKQYNNSDCTDELIQFRLDESSLYFSTGRIAVIVIRHKFLETSDDKLTNNDGSYPFHYIYKEESGKIITKVVQSDIKLIYNLFSMGYTPLLLFLNDPNSLMFMERAQITKAALSVKHGKGLIGLPMNGKDMYSSEEDIEDIEDINSLKALLKKRVISLRSEKQISSNLNVDPLGEMNLKQISNAEKIMLGDDVQNLLALLHTSSEAAKEAYNISKNSNNYKHGTNNDLRTFDEYKAINSSWKAGFSTGSGGEMLWAEFQLVNAAIRLTGIAPILFDSSKFTSVEDYDTPCDEGLVALSRVISSSLDYKNPEDTKKVLKFTLLNYTGIHYNGIKFKSRDEKDNFDDNAEEKSLSWRSISPDFTSLPDSVKHTIYLNFFIYPMVNASYETIAGTLVPSFNKEDVINTVYTGIRLDKYDLKPKGLQKFINTLGIKGIKASEWLDVIVAKSDGLSNLLSIVNIENIQSQIKKVSDEMKNIGKVNKKDKDKIKDRIKKLFDSIQYTRGNIGISGDLVKRFSSKKVFDILESVPNYLIVIPVGNKMIVTPHIVWKYLAQKLEIENILPTAAAIVKLANNKEIMSEVVEYIEEIYEMECPLAPNRFTHVRADENDMSIKIKDLAKTFFDDIILNGVANAEEIEENEDWAITAMKVWCDMSIEDRIEYYKDYIFSPVDYAQILEESDEEEEDIYSRLYDDFSGCDDLSADEDWVGRYVNEPMFFSIVSSPGDGNCFFWSMAQALFFEKYEIVVDEGNSEDWKILAKQLRYEVGQKITLSEYTNKVELFGEYKNWRAMRSMIKMNEQLRKKIEFRIKQGSSKLQDFNRFNNISSFLESLDQSIFSAYTEIDFKQSLFFATEPSDIVNGRAPMNMSIVRYWDNGTRKSIQRSIEKFPTRSIPKSIHSTHKKSELSCFGLMTKDEISIEKESEDELVIFEDEDEEYVEDEGEEYDEDDYDCDYESSQEACEKSALSGNNCFWDFDTKNCTGYE